MIENWHDAMERIVSATGAPYCTDIDRRQLYDGICDAIANYRTFEAFGKAGEARHKRILGKANRAKRLICSLAELLNDPEFSGELTDLGTIERGNAVASEAIGAILSKPEFAKIHSALNPIAYLVGRQLPRVYQHHFGRKAGRSRPAMGGDLRGPYLAFAVAVLREFDLGDYSTDYVGQMYAAGAEKGR
jgi:hypothetical protein